MEPKNAQSQGAAPRTDDYNCTWTAEKKPAAEVGLVANIKARYDEFVNTSMDQHKTCVKKAMNGFCEYIKLKKESFGSSKADIEADSAAKEAATSPPQAKATAAH